MRATVTVYTSLRHLTLAFTVDGVGVDYVLQGRQVKGGEKEKKVPLQVNTILIYQENMYL